MHLEVAVIARDQIRTATRMDAAVIVLADAIASRYGTGAELAPQIVAELVAAEVAARPTEPGPARLAAGVQRARSALAALAAHEPHYAGIAAVATAIVVDDAGIHVGYAGDVRAYRVRDGVVRWLTEDHVEVGAITRTIGGDAAEFDVRTVDAAVGDVLVLVPRERHTSLEAIATAMHHDLRKAAFQIAGGQSAVVARVEA